MREFLDAMESAVPWTELVSLIEPYAPEGGCRGQQPFAVQTLLRIHLMQQWFKLSDPALVEVLNGVLTFRDFVGLSHWDEHIPSESRILRFSHLPERHKLADQIRATVNALLQAKRLQFKAGMVVDAALIVAPSSTKIQSGEHDPEVNQSKKGNQWYFDMKAHIRVDADSGVVHSVRGTHGIQPLSPFITLCCDERDVVEALSRGANDVMSKPLHMEELVARTRSRRCMEWGYRLDAVTNRTTQDHQPTSFMATL